MVQIRILFFHSHPAELIHVFCILSGYLILPKLVYHIHLLATGKRKATPTKYDILSEQFIGRQLKFALCKMIFSSFTWFLKFRFLPMRLKFQSIKLFVFTTVNGPILHCYIHILCFNSWNIYDFFTSIVIFYATRPQNSIVLPIFSRVLDLPLVVKNDVLSQSNFGELQVAVLLKIKVGKKKQKNIWQM